MERIKLVLVGLGLAVALSGCAAETSASVAAAGPFGRTSPQTLLVSDSFAPRPDKKGPDNGAKGNKGNRGGAGKGNKNGRDNSASNQGLGSGNGNVGNAAPPAERGLEAWWRNFRERLFAGSPELKQGGWQLGRIKNAVQPESARATPTRALTATPSPIPTGTLPGTNGSWQRSRFFNAFSFAYPQGWSMDRLGDTAHLQGDYQGQTYVTDMAWVRDTPQAGLEQWARADLSDLGVSMEGVRLDYTGQGNDAQIAVATGVRIRGYQCPVVRMYVLANNAAAGGQRAFSVTVAQANGQACSLQALEDLAVKMVQGP